jgi:hypothetical protein
MPANRVVESAYIGPFASIDVVNAQTLYKPGELGIRVCTNNKQYQQVQLDSGALSAATNGQILYWKDKANYIVTNNNLFANGGATTTTSKSFVAGVATTAVTAGYYTFIQQMGRHSAVQTDSVTTTLGDSLVPSTNTGKATNASAGAGVAPPGPLIGVVATAATSATTQVADLMITGIV